MADTQQSAPNTDKAQTPQRDTDQTGRRAQETVEGEPRSFQRNGGGHGGDAALHTAETSRQAAETARRASREIAESWHPLLEPFTAMQMEMNRWFDDAFRHMAGFGLPAWRAARPFAGQGVAPLFGLPATDIKETEKSYALAIELPGLGRQDVEIAIDGDLLVVSGHKSEEREDASAAYRIAERRYGRFERSFPLPPDVDRNQIEAAFHDGVLRVTLPRRPNAAPKRSKIEIKG